MRKTIYFIILFLLVEVVFMTKQCDQLILAANKHDCMKTNRNMNSTESWFIDAGQTINSYGEANGDVIDNRDKVLQALLSCDTICRTYFTVAHEFICT